MNAIRNRIKAHRRVRAGDLVPHELNPRLHSETQRATLTALYEEIGFARSLLAYEMPDGRLKLIDGHLRRSMDPDMEVEVEVLDVSDAEARALLLSLDPLAQLAGYDTQVLNELAAQTETQSEQMQQLWDLVAASTTAVQGTLAKARQGLAKAEPVPEQFLVLIHCDDEEAQMALLERLQAEGLRCEAKVS